MGYANWKKNTRFIPVHYLMLSLFGNIVFLYKHSYFIICGVQKESEAGEFFRSVELEMISCSTLNTVKKTSNIKKIFKSIPTF